MFEPPPAITSISLYGLSVPEQYTPREADPGLSPGASRGVTVSQAQIDDALGQTARKLHADATVVDCHLDLLMTVALQRQIGARGSFDGRWLPELRTGGVKV